MGYLTHNKDQVLGSICNFCQVNQIKYEKLTGVFKTSAPKKLKTLYNYLCVMVIKRLSQRYIIIFDFFFIHIK